MQLDNRKPVNPVDQRHRDLHQQMAIVSAGSVVVNFLMRMTAQREENNAIHVVVMAISPKYADKVEKYKQLQLNSRLTFLNTQIAVLKEILSMFILCPVLENCQHA